MTRITHILRTNGIALIALFFALGGTAVAAGGLLTGDKIAQETITGGNILNGSVAGADLTDLSVSSWDIANDAIAGYKVADGSLSGKDIAPSSLDGTDIADGSIGLSRLAVKEGAWNAGGALGSIAAGACKTAVQGGMPAGAPTIAISTAGGVSASSATVDGSGYTSVTLCNHRTTAVSPGFLVYAFQA